MPEYTGQIAGGKLNCNRPDLINRWIQKNENRWFKADFKLIGPEGDAKTAAQLGYYWAVLVPEIRDELNAQGHTPTITFNKLQAEIPYNSESTHDLLTQLCNHVGEDGALMRMSDPDMTIGRMVQVINNVLDFAVVTLGMNEEALKARRPE